MVWQPFLFQRNYGYCYVTRNHHPQNNLRVSYPGYVVSMIYDMVVVDDSSPPALVGVVDPSVLVGVVDPSALVGVVDPSVLVGVVHPSALVGVVDPSALVGVVHPSALVGVVDPSAWRWVLLYSCQPAIDRTERMR